MLVVRGENGGRLARTSMALREKAGDRQKWRSESSGIIKCLILVLAETAQQTGAPHWSTAGRPGCSIVEYFVEMSLLLNRQIHSKQHDMIIKDIKSRRRHYARMLVRMRLVNRRERGNLPCGLSNRPPPSSLPSSSCTPEPKPSYFPGSLLADH